MVDNKFIDQFVDKLNSLLPAGAQEMKKDFEDNVRSTVQGFVGKLDVVPAEEFEIQVKLMERLRDRVIELEKRVAALEAQRESVSDRGEATSDQD